MFKEYKDQYLHRDGYKKISSGIILDIAKNMSKDLELISKLVPHNDVFRTKLGDIKQIQNLHKVGVNDKFIHYCANTFGGIEKVQILNSQYFCKPPNYKMTSAHQDNAYFESDDEIYTFWLPLQDVDLLNSCMFYVDGSHINGLVEHTPIGTNTRVRTGKKGVSLYSSHYKNKEFTKVPMKLGELLVHDKNCMHFSSPNLTDDYRFAVTCILKVIK